MFCRERYTNKRCKVLHKDKVWVVLDFGKGNVWPVLRETFDKNYEVLDEREEEALPEV